MTTITIDKYTIEPNAIPLGTVGSYGVEALQFEFSDDWTGLTIETNFYAAGSSTPIAVVLTDDIAEVPAEVTAVAGVGKLVVRGLADGVCINTVTALLLVSETEINPEPTPVTPSEMDQVLTILNDTKEIAQSVRDEADQGAFDGVSVTNAEVNAEGHLVVTLSNGNTIDTGYVIGPQGEQGEQGEQGVSVTNVQVNADKHIIVTLSDGSTIDAGAIEGYVTEEEFYKVFPTNTVSGATVTFADGADDIPVKSFDVDIQFTQSGSGDPSPSNVRPITGRIGAIIDVGRNSSEPEVTYAVDWTDEAGTVYGGTLDVTNGVLTVTHGYILGSDSRLDWRQYFNPNMQTGLYCYTVYPNLPNQKSKDLTQKIVSSHFTQVRFNWTTVRHGQMFPDFAGDSVYCFVEDIDTLSAFKAWLASAGVQFVYELETPETYQLAPTEIATLLGQNVIRADTGDVSITYRVDPNIVYEQDRPFTITVTVTSQTAGTADKTADEIIAAVNAGKTLRVIGILGTVNYTFQNIVISQNDDQIAVAAYGVMEPEGIFTDMYMPWGSGTDNSWELANYQLTPYGG